MNWPKRENQGRFSTKESCQAHFSLPGSSQTDKRQKTTTTTPITTTKQTMRGHKLFLLYVRCHESSFPCGHERRYNSLCAKKFCVILLYLPLLICDIPDLLLANTCHLINTISRFIIYQNKGMFVII